LATPRPCQPAAMLSRRRRHSASALLTRSRERGSSGADSPIQAARLGGLASRRTAELAADLVEPAKSAALEKLGEGQRAFGIANAWVRTKMVPRATDLA
jgi:hypothetical protein